MRQTPVTVGMVQKFAAELRGRARGYAGRVNIWGDARKVDQARHDVLMEIAELLDRVFGRAEDDL